MAHRLADLAELTGSELVGNGERRVEAVRPLALAGPEDLGFALDRRHLAAALQSRAGVLLLSSELADEPFDGDRLLAADPKLALAEILARIYPKAPIEPGVHETAVVADSAVIAASASIGPYVCIGAGARVGARAHIHAHVVIGADCVLADDVELHPNVTLYAGTRIGARSVVHAGTVLGADGFGYASGSYGHVKLAQVGHTELGDDVEVGANSAIDRAALDVTRIGSGSKIDNLVQVGHNVQVGEHCVLSGEVGLAGSSVLEDFVVLGGQAGVTGHLTVGSGVQAAAKSLITQDIEPGVTVAGIPAQPIMGWHRQVSSLRRLSDLRKRLRALESAVERLAGEGGARGGRERSENPS